MNSNNYEIEIVIKTDSDTSGLEQIDSSSSSTTAGLEVLSEGLAAASKVLVGFGTAASTAALNYDAAMNTVAAVTGLDLGGDQMSELNDIVTELGVTTPKSMSDIAAGLETAGRAGVSFADMTEIIEPATKMAVIANGDVATAMSHTVDIMNAFQLESSEMGKVMDVMTVAANNANLDIDSLAESFKYTGAVAKQYDVSLEETAALTAILANNGIKGSMAGTSLRQMFKSLKAPTDSAAAALDELGVNVYNMDGSSRNMTDVLTDMSGAMSNLSEEEKNAALSSIFQTRAMASAAISIGATGDAVAGTTMGLEDFLSTLDDSEGATDEMFETMMDGAVGVEERMAAATDAVFTTFGQQINDLITPIKELFTNIMQGLVDLSPETKKILSILGMVVVGVSAILSAFLALKIALGPILAATGSSLGAILLPILAIVAGVAIVIAAVVRFRDRIMDAIEEPLKAAKSMFKSLVAVVKPIIRIIMVLVDILINVVGAAILGILDSLAPVMTVVFGFLKKVFDFLGPLFTFIADWLEENKEIISLIAEIVGYTIGRIVGYLMAAVAVIYNIVAVAIGFIINYIKPIALFIAEVVMTIVNIVIETVKIIIDIVKVVVDVVVKIVTAIWKFIKPIVDIIIKIIKVAVKIITTTIAVIIGVIYTIVWAIWQIIKPVIDVMVEFFVTLWNNTMAAFEVIKEFLVGVWTWVKDTILTPVVTFIKKLWNGFITALNTAKNKVLLPIVNFIKDKIIKPIQDAFTGLKDILSGIFDKITTTLDGFKEGALDVVTGIKTGITNMWDGLVTLLKTPLNLLIDGINFFIRQANKIALPDWDVLGSFAGKGFNFGEIDHLATGGLVDSPTIAEIGEGRHKEAVIPLEPNAIANFLRGVDLSQGNGVTGGSEKVVINNENTYNTGLTIDELLEAQEEQTRNDKINWRMA